jgi:hypothetical protein
MRGGLPERYVTPLRVVWSGGLKPPLLPTMRGGLPERYVTPIRELHVAQITIYAMLMFTYSLVPSVRA